MASTATIKMLLELSEEQRKMDNEKFIESQKKRAERLAKIFTNSVDFFSYLIGIEVLPGQGNNYGKDKVKVTEDNFVELAGKSLLPVFNRKEEDCGFVEFRLNA